MATSFLKVSDGGVSILAANITTTSQTNITIDLADVSWFPTSGTFYIDVYNNSDPEIASSFERMAVTSVASNVFTVTRNIAGMSQTFVTGNAVRLTILKKHLDDITTAVNTIENTLDTRLPVGTVVGTTDTQTLTNKTISSPTVTGFPTYSTAYYGESSLATTYSITGTNSWQNIGLSVSLPSAGTYLVSFDAYVVLETTTTTKGIINLRLHDGTNPITDSEKIGAYNTIAYLTCAGQKIITVTGAKTIHLQARRDYAAGYSVSNISNSTDGRTAMRYIRLNN